MFGRVTMFKHIVKADSGSISAKTTIKLEAV